MQLRQFEKRDESKTVWLTATEINAIYEYDAATDTLQTMNATLPNVNAAANSAVLG